MDNKPTILIFIDWFTPAYKAGGPIRSCANLIEHLGNRFKFKVICRNTDYCETTPLEGIVSNEWNRWNETTDVYYLSENQLSIKKINQLLAHTSFDVAYINGVYSFWFSILPLALINKNKKQTVVAARGMLSAHALGIKSLKKNLFLKTAYNLGLYRKVIFHATNENEADDIQQMMPKNEIRIAPNLPKKKNETPVKRIDKKRNYLKLCSIARISPEKNTLYAIEVLRNVLLNIEFSIYGAIYNEAYWQQCLAAIAQLPDNVKVEYRGVAQPADIDSVLQQHHFLFMPTRGENFGHIILESFMNSRPVIISNKTPWQNLKRKNCGWNLDVENRAEFAEVIDYCALMEHDEYDLMTENALSMANLFHQNEGALRLNEELFA